MTRDEKTLLEAFRSLNDDGRETLLAFAEFLRTRSVRRGAEIPPPERIPRPEQETVIAAIKRLSRGYPMLNKSKLLNESSMLVAQHVIQGRCTREVIDELERIFERHYQRAVSGSED
jgi:hypothetical protein